jgi:uncharacterized protein YbjT (DUF2867 family)
MAGKKVIAVIGATGAQGGGLARAILADRSSEFGVRAITRKPDSDKARELASLGAEVVQGDMDDVESVTRAFTGVYGAFCVTPFWEHFSPEREKKQAENMAEAAKRAGLRHVIWSTLEDTRRFVPLGDDRMPTLQGKYKVPHFDAKGEADEFFRKRGVPTTFLVASYYWENLIYFGQPVQRGDDGIMRIALPMGDKRLAGVAAEDIGKVAYGIFKEGTSLAGKTIGVAGEHLTVAQMAKKLGAALGEEVRYQDVPLEVARSSGAPGADDVTNMFQFYQDFEKEGLELRSVERSRQLNPELKSFDQWLKENASRLQEATPAR